MNPLKNPQNGQRLRLLLTIKYRFDENVFIKPIFFRCNVQIYNYLLIYVSATFCTITKKSDL